MGRLSMCIGAMGLVACGRVGFDPASKSDGGGSGDGRMLDAAPQPLCATKYQGAVLCDDFELNLDNWFIAIEGTNEILQDTSFFRSGTASAHVIGRELGSARLIATVLGGRTSGTLYFRYYQWVPASAALTSITMLHLVSNVLPYPGLVLSVEPPSMWFDSNIDFTQGPRVDVPLPRDRWACVQATLAIAQTGSISTAFDGVPAATFTGNTREPNGYTDLHVGMFVQQNAPIEMWIDDLVVDVNPVPCD